MSRPDLTTDHAVLADAHAARRYFGKFERIMVHLKEVVDLTHDEGSLTKPDAFFLKHYLTGLSNAFTALSYKYLMGQRAVDGPGTLMSIDKVNSGFPVFQEILQMASDALQAGEQVERLPEPERIKREMVTHILSHQSAPTRLQYALSQRLYYEALLESELFLARNLPGIEWLYSNSLHDRRTYLVHWAVYDSQSNVPMVYLMELEDTGRRALPRDERRWPQLQDHLLAQSISSLNLLTIARGVDTDFEDIHPKSLRRFYFGPMYSHVFTRQQGPLRDILAESDAPAGQDWALTWTVETLLSEKSVEEKSGWFSKVEREVYKIDKLDPALSEAGLTARHQALMLPLRAYQVMREREPASLRGVYKYVVGAKDKILSYR